MLAPAMAASSTVGPTPPPLSPLLALPPEIHDVISDHMDTRTRRGLAQTAKDFAVPYGLFHGPPFPVPGKDTLKQQVRSGGASARGGSITPPTFQTSTHRSRTNLSGRATRPRR